VGKNLRDHLGFMVTMTAALPNTDFRHMRSLGAARTALSYLLFRKGFFSRSSVRAIGIVGSEVAEPGWPDLKMQFFNLLMDDGPGIGVSQHGFLVRLSMTRPGSTGSVTLRSANPDDHPRIDANYLSDPIDLARARSGVRIARDIFRQPAMARFRKEEVAPGRDVTSDAQIDAWLRRAAGGDAHGIGTCRMGHDDNAVVDPELRVHGVDGLRVIDASVMPTHVCGNTVAPTMMVAEKGAEMALHRMAIAGLARAS
jgi:choline dehydrogenase